MEMFQTPRQKTQFVAVQTEANAPSARATSTHSPKPPKENHGGWSGLRHAGAKAGKECRSLAWAIGRTETGRKQCIRPLPKGGRQISFRRESLLQLPLQGAENPLQF